MPHLRPITWTTKKYSNFLEYILDICKLKNILKYFIIKYNLAFYIKFQTEFFIHTLIEKFKGISLNTSYYFL